MEKKIMGGAMSRRKGYNGERNLVLQLRKEGFNAHRVPLSGAAQGYKGDIIVEKDGKEVTIEVKVRQNEFRSIYALAELSFSPSFYINYGTKRALISRAIDGVGYFLNPDFEIYSTVSTKNERTLKKLFKLEKFVKTCDLLAIKIDYKPYLFIRFLHEV